MKHARPLTVAVAALALLGTAYADDITVEAQPFTSSRTRAEVQAELQAFRAAGGDSWAENYTPPPPPYVGKTRAEVLAELKEYRASGVNPWADDYSQSLQAGAGKTRAQVQAEYAAAKAAGELPNIMN